MSPVPNARSQRRLSGSLFIQWVKRLSADDSACCCVKHDIEAAAASSQHEPARRTVISPREAASFGAVQGGLQTVTYGTLTMAAAASSRFQLAYMTWTQRSITLAAGTFTVRDSLVHEHKLLKVGRGFDAFRNVERVRRAR